MSQLAALQERVSAYLTYSASFGTAYAVQRIDYTEDQRYMSRRTEGGVCLIEGTPDCEPNLTVRYTLFKAIVAIFDAENTTSTIPAGGVVETLAPLPDLGLVQVRYEGRVASVTARDLRECGTIDEDE